MEKLKPIIIYENKDFAVINKPAGLLVHHVKGHETKEKTLVDWLGITFPEVKNVGDDPQNRPGIVHRLDKDTSGIMVVARNQAYFSYLKKEFQEHKVQKTYLALVSGEVKAKKGVIDKPIALKAGTTKRTVFKGKMLKEAITEFELIKTFSYEDPESSKRKVYYFSLLKVMPKTGRTHQIRVHLASMGHPIAGDSLYGQKQNIIGLDRQFLHASAIEFKAEKGSLVEFEAPLSSDLLKVLERLENN